MIAPTGTIGLVMDCDTTGIEPDFALVKFKKLAGGGYFKIINHAVPRCAAHARLPRGARSPRSRPTRSATARSSRRPAINPATLRAKGFTDDKIEAVEKGLKTAFDIKFVFNKWTLGEDFLTGTLEVPAEKLDDPAFDLLAHLGFSEGRDRGRQHPRLRRHDARRRAAPEARALPGVRLRQPVRPASASATSRSRATSA